MNPRRFVLLALVFLVAVSNVASTQSYPRQETIYAGGGLWAPPSNWNPIVPWACTTGTIGLVYETLFLYDPLKNEFIPWLAEEGSWVAPDTYRLRLRAGISWTDGTPLTVQDVKFTFELARKFPGIYYSGLWEWLSEIVVVDDLTLEFVFSDPHYHEWQYNLYQIPILPKHLWEGRSEEEVLSGSNEGGIGSGPYVFGPHTSDRQVYIRNEDWWGTELLGLKPSPKYIVYLRFVSNNVALGQLLKGELDWSNYFLPGIPRLVKFYGIHTFYPEPPYMLPANTAFLFLNTKKPPLDNPAFRRAMAFAIDPRKIVDTVFEKQVTVANPVGFVPIDSWMSVYPEEVVKEYGFSYNPAKAEEILDAAGFVDRDGDGLRETPEGERMHLSIIVPFGWTDWMESIKIIAEQLRDVGIDVEAKFPDFSKYAEDMYNGTFDILLNNFGSTISATVWTLYNWLFQPVVEGPMYSGNFGRYENPKLMELVEDLNRTPWDDVAAAKEVVAKIAEIFLKEMPQIPLWYNGAWFHASTAVWKNWPSVDNPYAVPISWGGWWQLGGIMTLMGITSQ